MATDFLAKKTWSSPGKLFRLVAGEMNRVALIYFFHFDIAVSCVLRSGPLPAMTQSCDLLVPLLMFALNQKMNTTPKTSVLSTKL